MCNYLRLETTLRHSTFYRLGSGTIKLCGAQGNNYVPTTHVTYVHGGWWKRKSLSKGRSRLLGKTDQEAMLKKQNQNYLIKKLCPSPRVLLNGSYFSIFPSLEWQILFCPSPTTENQLCERQSTYYFLGFFFIL